ncbi:hypothetical protein GQ54DRAFT_296372 [Martensiomyces pterosporus]|nr:hypothetical protein GQ54DRAFT_296372 [Martensiomyces pterosporus]
MSAPVDGACGRRCLGSSCLVIATATRSILINKKRTTQALLLIALPNICLAFPVFLLHCPRCCCANCDHRRILIAGLSRTIAGTPTGDTVHQTSPNITSEQKQQQIQPVYQPRHRSQQQFPDSIDVEYYVDDLLAQASQPTQHAEAAAASCAQPEMCADNTSNDDTSDEELYLRRVSVLYHELWCSEWMDRQLSSDGLPLDGGSKRPSAIAANEEVIGSTNTTDSIGIASSRRDCSAEALASTTKEPTLTAETVATIGVGYNEPQSNADVAGAACSTVFESQLASQAETAARQESTPATGAAVTGNNRLALVSCFTPPDLADALIGTVHRLEDECTLLQHKRWSVVKELATTEAHYLRDLLLLRTVFFEPLSGTDGSGLLRSEDARAIFGNLDEVIDCARSLVEYLTVAVIYEANRCLSSGNDEAHNDNRHTTSGSVLGSRADQPPKWKYPNRPVSQPEALRMDNSAKSSGVGLRNSAWADISIAQAFLLTSRRMEKVYAQYCRNFDAANQRLIDLKKSASSASGGGASTPNTMPATPVTGYRQSAASSPFVEHHKGRRQSNNNNSSSNNNNSNNSNNNNNNNNGSSSSSNSNRVSGVNFGGGSKGNQLDLSDPETMYAIVVYQFISDQSQFLAGKTTSWDLPSLLIKPVQRILKYPLLLRSLLGLTLTRTSDRNQLERAAQSIEYIAEAINSGSSSGGAVAASSGASGNVRVSTATTALVSSMANDDSHSRITREIRRVLRRKPGTVGRLRARSNADSAGKDKQRSSLRSSRKAKDTAVPDELDTATADGPSPDIEMLIEQHELQLSELIRSLRRWENDLGSMLCQQVTMLSRWRDFYTVPDAESDWAYPTAEPQAAGSDRRACWELLNFEEMLREDCHHPRFACNRPRIQPVLRSSKSYGRLPSHVHGFAPDDSHLAGASHISSPFARHCSNMELGQASSCGEDPVWKMRRKENVVRYHAALETIYKTHYPNCLCSPLHSRIYSALNSLLQIYSDGPRRILGQIARLSNRDSSSGTSASIEQDEAHAASLESALLSELPQLFYHERKVVQLLQLQLALLERDFYNQVVKELSSASVGFFHDRPGLALQMSAADTESPNDLISLSPLAAYKLQPVHWGREIADGYERRVSERGTGAGAKVALPSASECLSNIQSGLYMLAREAEGDSVPQYVVKARRRRSVSDSMDGIDGEVSCDSLGSYDTVERDESALPLPTRNSGLDVALNRYATTPNNPFPEPQRQQQQQHTNSPAAPSTTPKPKLEKTSMLGHARKKSSGFIERFSQLKSGMPSRENLRFSTMKYSRHGSGDQVKPRAPLGLAIDVSPNESGEGDAAYPLLQAERGSGSLRPAPGAGGNWLDQKMRYEPLPLVDSIRFSRGFIDSTFQRLNSPGPLDTDTRMGFPGVADEESGEGDICG